MLSPRTCACQCRYVVITCQYRATHDVHGYRNECKYCSEGCKHDVPIANRIDTKGGNTWVSEGTNQNTTSCRNYCQRTGPQEECAYIADLPRYVDTSTTSRELQWRRYERTKWVHTSAYIKCHQDLARAHSKLTATLCQLCTNIQSEVHIHNMFSRLRRKRMQFPERGVFHMSRHSCPIVIKYSYMSSAGQNCKSHTSTAVERTAPDAATIQ